MEKDAELKEDKKKPQIKDVVKTIYEKGKAVASKLFGRSFFDVAKTPDFMKKLGLTGDRFTIKYGVLSRHAGKDASHSLTEKQWEELPDAIQKPFAITRFGGKDNGYRLYTTMKNDKGETIVVGVDVKNAGRDMEVNAISTIFGRRNDAMKTQKEEVLYMDENITPEQRSLLGQPNSDQYTGTREKNVSIDKGSEVGGEKQEAEKKRPAPLSERIEDVGEKIGDARKDVWKEIIARIKNKKQGIEEALKKSSAGKLFSSLFDEKELLESGVSNEVVTFISAVKGSLGTKPRSLSKLKMWINKVLHQYDMCEQALENWESVKKKIDEWKYYSQPFYMYRAAMAVGGYESGHDVGNAELWQIADGYSDGKSVAGQWCVRKAGAYDGIYKTYEEAAEALKKFAGENAAVDGKGKRKEVKLAIYKRRTDGTMFIAPEGKPDVIIQDGFKTLYEASAYKKEHYAEMQERYRTLMDGIKPKFNENRERKGRDWRGGKDVSAEDFREAFDFRGVEFGNWMQQKDRRQALNECYDSLMDLAMVCGVSPKALSLGGKLAMAFGARGVGKFNAHYEPDKVVINLTKTKGAGSLAHEWFHAIDNYFNMQGWDEFATESTRNVERKEMAEAWKDLVRAINGSDYFKRSDKYARLKGSRYWIEPTELGARAFAVWVENRLSKYGTINDYLANNPRIVDEKASDAEKKYAPYPFDKDADWMDEKFGRLFEVMQERVDEETGKHILYSRNKAAGHELTELTEEERELRDNLVERMRKGGLDVVTDSEEMQRVIDTENERTRNKRSKKSEAARKRDEALYAVDWSTAFVSGKSREEATEIRRERGRKFKEETKELYGRVLSGNFDDVTLRLIDEFIDKSTPNNPYERPISKRLPTRALQKMRGGERTGSVDALFSRICESTVGKDGKALPRAERERAIEEKKKELLKKWAIATGNWHTDVSDFSDGKEPIGSGTDSDVYLSKDGKSVIKVSKGKPYGKRFRPDVDNVALFNTVFPGSRYTIEGYGEIDGKFVRFLKQPFVDFSDSTPLTEGERVAYMEKLGFKPINKENTAFSNGEIIASDLQKSNIVKDKQGNVRVIDADMKLHTKDVGGNYSYPDVETDTTGLAEREEVNAGSVREHRVYHGSGADFDAFDHSHMGEGEGAQAYGWGTYVTEVEGIGRTYAVQNTTTHNDALRALQHDVDAISDQLNRHRDDLKYDEEQLKRANEWRAEAELDYELFKDEAEKLKEKYGEASPEYRNHLFNDIYTDEMKRAQRSVKSIEESIQYRKEKIAELGKALKDKQAEVDELPKKFPHHLYTVEIPDDNGSNYLDWDGHPAESLLKDVGSFLESIGFERVQDNPVRYEKGESTVVLNPNATGADLYAELQEALGGDKKASQALAELGYTGIKYPADYMRGGRKDGAKNYVIFNENDAKITDHTRFLRTAGGEVYGLVKDGRIYLDPKVATSETAVHEYTHLWGDMLRRKDSEQWSHTVKELKDSVLWEEVKESYPELKTDDEIADEVLSTFSGRRGAERLREEARRVADGEGGVFTKAKAIETLERVKEAIARFWEGVARMFGINRYRSAEELADMAMRDLLDSKNPMKDESGMRKRGEVGDEGVKSLKGEEAMVALDNIFEDKKTENMPQKVSSLVKFMELFRKPVRTFLGEVVNVKEEVYNKIIREKRTSISGAVLPTLENADFAIRDTDGSTLYIKRFKSENNDNVYNIAVVNKYGEVEDYVSSVHIKSDNNLRNKITKGAELLLPQERITDGTMSRNNSTPDAKVANYSETAKPRLSRKPGESIFDYASRVSDSVDRSVRERVSARDEYEKKVKSKGFQTKEALQNSMLGLQEFMFAIDHASGNKRYIEDIPDFENPILGENRLSSVNKEEMHQVAKTQFKPLMSAVAKLSGNGKESGELYDYMFAKHGLERDAVMRQREAQKEFDKYQKAHPKGTKTIGDFVASLEGKDYAGLTALTAEDGRVKSIQSQIDAIDEQMKTTDDQLLLRNLGGQKKRLKVDLLKAARDAADDIRKAFESNPSHDRSDINELWKRVNEVNGNTLRKLYESGLLTKEAYNDINSMYTHYIPMRGFDQTTSADAYAYLTHSDSAFNAPIKTAKGRSSKADNPIAYMQAMAESARMQGNRNVLVKQKMLNFVRNHPSDLASVSDVWLQYDSVADEWKPVFPDNIGANDSASVVAKKMEAFEDKMKQMAEKHPNLVQRSNEAPDIPYKVVEKGQLNEHQVLVKQNGKSYIITVNGSPRAAQAANGLTNPDTDLTGAVGKVFEVAEALNRQLSSLYTTFKPGFVGANYVRDALYSNTMVYVKEGARYGGSFNLNFAKYNPGEMANLYARYNKGNLDTSNETHRLFLEFMQNGGETGFVNLKQIEKRKSEIAKAIKRDGEISAARFWGGLNNSFDFANKTVENSARFAAYVTSRKSGRSVGRSEYDAKEISVNFNRKGSGRNWWKDNVGASRFYDTEIGLVEINKASVGSSLAHRYSQVKLDAITSLADGFNNAVYLGSMPDFSRQEGVKSHYFAYPINYNGHRNYVFCRAMQDANKNRLYVHEVFLADNIEKGNTLQTAASQPHGGITLYKDILANVLTANVTNNFETSKPRYSRKPGESIFDYASRVSEDVDRSVCEGR